jgi:TrpR-related protein YerC/YecD
MQVSKKHLNKTIEKQIYSILYQLIVDIKNQDEATRLFGDILSPTELEVIAKRVAIAIFLDKGRSYENIKSTLKVSSATIASVQETMGNPGILLALQKIKAEQWADQWAGKISSIVGKIIPGK